MPPVQYPLSVKIAAFFSLAAVQVGVALVYKASQSGTKKDEYTFHPSSALTLSEFIKIWLSFFFFFRETQSKEQDAKKTTASPLPVAASSTTATPSTTTSSSSSSSGGGDDSAATVIHVPSFDSDSSDRDKLLLPTSVGAQSSASVRWSHTLQLTIAAFKAQITRHLALSDLGLATLYCINNHLSFFLFLWADSASITLIKSGSTFISAFILFVFLGRAVNHLQWAAICLQVFGLIIVQYDPCKSTTILSPSVYAILFVAVSISSITSVWNENIIKTNAASLHVQNMVLYFFGTILNLLAFFIVPAIVPQAKKWSELGFFEGYTLAALGVVLANSVIGIVVTAVYKYADAIVKTFGSATATCVLLFINSAFFNLSPTLVAVLGCGVVFIASYVYFVGGTLPAPPVDANAGAASSSDWWSENSRVGRLVQRFVAPLRSLRSSASTQTILIVAGVVLFGSVLLVGWSISTAPSQSSQFSTGNSSSQSTSTVTSTSTSGTRDSGSADESENDNDNDGTAGAANKSRRGTPLHLEAAETRSGKAFALNTAPFAKPRGQQQQQHGSFATVNHRTAFLGALLQI